MIQSRVMQSQSIYQIDVRCISLPDLWFPAGTFRGVCKDIDHFAEDADYEQDAAEYLLRR